MKKVQRSIMAMLMLAVMLLMPGKGKAAGWPANYEGVMLQGFYWDSYKGSNTTKWTDLTSRADELSQYFKLIWVANCSQASGEMGGGNGYMPQYWFSHHNCAFGTEAELKTMISTFKAKGTGFIEDVVINHRVGITNWTDFPVETWNGQTWKIGPEGICNTDEVKNEPGQARPTGAADTGEDFNGARDLDHTNANVQNNCKNYCKYLLTDLGFVGFRLDMVKGYGGQYTKIYNQYSNPTFSVGEYWDGSYDAVKGWIDATGKTSAAFDFPFKYQVNKCFNGGAHNYSELVWKANGTTDQPAGMIHFGYSQYAVTFIDNHDTYRDGSKMTGDVLQANAFMLSCPGTPCVFWPHYTQYKSQIQAMINARNGVGIHNNSAVKVLEVNGNCYVAEVTGTKGKLWIKLGSSSRTPGSGYTKKASGNGYEIWTTSQGGDTPVDPVDPSGDLWILGNLEGAAGWGSTPGTGVKMTQSGTTYTAKGVKFVAATGETACYFNLTDFVGATWDALNEGANRYGAATEGEAITVGSSATIVKYANNVNASGCKSWIVPAGTYDVTADLSTMKITVVNAGTNPDPDPDPTPVTGNMWILGNLDGAAGWSTTPGTGVKMTNGNGEFTAKEVVMVAAAGETRCYFNLTDYVGATWDDLNMNANRYGAATEGEAITLGQPATVVKYANNVNASGCLSWTVAPGIYNFSYRPGDNTIMVTNSASAIDVIENDFAPVEYYNLQGIRVLNPSNGVYIMKQGTKVTKVYVR